MKLYINDRIYLPAVFPKNGDYAAFSTKRSINQKIAITDEEVKKYSIKQTETENGPHITWDIKKDLEEPIEVAFTEGEIDFLKKSCESLSNEAKPDDFWLVVEKIYNA